MVDIGNVKEKFSKDLICLNLDNKEKFVYNKEGLIPDIAKYKIEHLSNSIFEDVDKFIEFLIKKVDIKVDVFHDNFNSFLNESLKYLHLYVTNHPTFSLFVGEMTYDTNYLNIISYLSQLYASYCESNGESNLEIVPINESKDPVSNETIRNYIFNDLDKTSVSLLYGMISGSLSTSLTDNEARHKILNHVKNNKNSLAGESVMKGIEKMSYSTDQLINHFKLNECINIMALEEGGKIDLSESNYSVSRINKDYFLIKENKKDE